MAILKKKNGIDEKYYLENLDRTDTINALQAAGLTQEEMDWVFTSDGFTNKPTKAYIEG